MIREPTNDADHDMSEEYDFSGGVRGKYVDRFPRACNIVILDPNAAHVVTDSESVNQALRALVSIIQDQPEKPERS